MDALSHLDASTMRAEYCHNKKGLLRKQSNKENNKKRSQIGFLLVLFYFCFISVVTGHTLLPEWQGMFCFIRIFYVNRIRINITNIYYLIFHTLSKGRFCVLDSLCKIQGSVYNISCLLSIKGPYFVKLQINILHKMDL